MSSAVRSSWTSFGRSSGSTTASAPIGSALVAGAGIALLGVRLPLTGLPAGTRVAAMFGLLLGVAAASWLAPVPSSSARMPRVAVLAVGLAGIAGAARLAGTPPGLPIGTWTLPLGLLAALAEELLFRRLAYAALARRSEALAVVVTTTVFALVHLPLYGVASFPVDLGAGLLFSWQRWASGSWTVPAATHAAANLLVVIR